MRQKSRVPLCKPLFIQITRKIPLKIEKTRQTVHKPTGLTLEQELLDFCKVPRGIHEIKEHLGIKSTDRVTKGFAKPLIDQGKLNFTIPDEPANLHQMYLTAGVERTPDIEEIIRQKSKRKENIELQEKILEYCKVPRTMKEIMEYLNMGCSTNVAQRVLRPLTAEGKLRFRYPSHGSNQQYINSEVEFNFVSGESIIEFCRTPRLVKEIREHFNITVSVYRGLVKPLMDAGKLVYTEYVKVGKFNMQRKIKSNG